MRIRLEEIGYSNDSKSSDFVAVNLQNNRPFMISNCHFIKPTWSDDNGIHGSVCIYSEGLVFDKNVKIAIQPERREVILFGLTDEEVNAIEYID